MLYVQPYQQNRDLLGLDLASDRVISALFARSRETRQLQVSEPVILLDEQAKERGFTVSVPVFHPENDAADGEEEPTQARLSPIRVLRSASIVSRISLNGLWKASVRPV